MPRPASRPTISIPASVILTGEALRRENAQGIANILSEQGGEFVTATAGHHMEAMLAAYGSGAARVSSDEHKRILNIDIGGGTTKLGLVENGKVIATAAVHIGGRLQVVEAGKIVRLDPAGKHHAKRAGFSWNRGDAVDPADLEKVADGMADALVAALTARPLPHDIAHLYLTDPIADLGRIDGVMFSGGVAEYIYQREDARFRRHGTAARPRHPRAHRARRAALAGAAGRRMHPRHRARRLGIQRPAVRQYQLYLGAGHAVAAPQSPGAAAAFRLRRNDRSAKARRTRSAATSRPSTSPTPTATSRWRCAGPACRPMSGSPPSPQASRAALPTASPRNCRSTSCSMATWRRRSAISCATSCSVESELLVIDGVVLWDFDYIDLGRIRMPSYTVPVTIKSLVFNEDPRGPRPRQRLHHHEHDHDMNMVITTMTMIMTTIMPTTSTMIMSTIMITC